MFPSICGEVGLYLFSCDTENIGGCDLSSLMHALFHKYRVHKYVHVFSDARIEYVQCMYM